MRYRYSSRLVPRPLSALALTAYMLLGEAERWIISPGPRYERKEGGASD